VLAERFVPGTPVLVVGADALFAEISAAGLRAVASADDRPEAVVQGYGPQVGWAALAEATVAIRAGAMWVATNTDRTLPTRRGPMPGNGAMVAALRTALDRGPDLVVGKPEPGLFHTAARRTAASQPLVVGDRLDTDIEGAYRAGMDSLLVLTGVSGARELIAAPAHQRPTYLATDLSGLFDVDEAVRVPELDAAADGADAGGWRVTRHEAGLELTGSGDPVDALRLLCAATWSGSGPQRTAPRLEETAPRSQKITAGSAGAAEALRALGLDA
jgi:glycerol 3-phosphatase-2